MSTKENEFGDKIDKSMLCAGVLFWVCSAVLFGCACARGCQEIKKHLGKNSNQAKVVFSEKVR